MNPRQKDGALVWSSPQLLYQSTTIKTYLCYKLLPHVWVTLKLHAGIELQHRNLFQLLKVKSEKRERATLCYTDGLKSSDHTLLTHLFTAEKQTADRKGF